MFPEQLTGGLEPWGGVRQVWLPGSPQAAHGVEVTETMDDGVASLLAHRAYLDGLGWDVDFPAFLRDAAQQAGERLGVPYAVAFEVIDLGWG